MTRSQFLNLGAATDASSQVPQAERGRDILFQASRHQLTPTRVLTLTKPSDLPTSSIPSFYKHFLRDGIGSKFELSPEAEVWMARVTRLRGKV